MAKQTLSAFAKELEKHDKALAQAFLEAIQDIKSVAQKTVIEEAVRRGDVQGVIEALRLGPQFYSPLDLALLTAFQQGAIWQQSQLPKKAGPQGAKLVIRFNQRNERAERWPRLRAGALITELSREDQKVAAETVEAGIREGRSASRISTDLIGKRVGNQRVGGVIGLHSKDARAVANARRELSDPQAMADYLRRSNAPYKRSVRAALASGKPLSKEMVEKIALSYSDKLLRDRGQRIARTEAHASFLAGQYEGIVQLVESGQVRSEEVTLEWQATVASTRTRDSHISLHGQRVKYGGVFVSPLTGARMAHPGDTSNGAGAEEVINCRCGLRPDINWLAMAV